jgi:hypothetical protein
VGAPEMQAINITSVIYNITLRNETGIDAPNFFMQLNFSVVTGPHQINLGSSPLSQGKDYIINYEYARTHIDIFNVIIITHANYDARSCPDLSLVALRRSRFR